MQVVYVQDVLGNGYDVLYYTAFTPKVNLS